MHASSNMAAYLWHASAGRLNHSVYKMKLAMDGLIALIAFTCGCAETSWGRVVKAQGCTQPGASLMAERENPGTSSLPSKLLISSSMCTSNLKGKRDCVNGPKGHLASCISA